MNIIYWAEINEVISFDEYERLLSFVSAEKQEQIARFHSDIDKKLSIVSEILIRTIICREKGLSNNEIVFEKNEFGKPFLKGYSGFYFNLSHTRNAITIATSDRPVGVDIEKIRDAEFRIAKRFFTEKEFDYITRNSVNMDERFYEVWTKKEAYIKYLGKGLSLHLNSFDVFDDMIAKQSFTFEKNEYVISTCSEYTDQQFNIIKLTENSIINKATKILR